MYSIDNVLNRIRERDTMAKKQEVATVADQEVVELSVPTALTPAAVVGSNTKIVIDQALLPEEFQGQELETIETGFSPTVKWVTPGNYVAGVYVSTEQGVGPNKANLYNFVLPAKHNRPAKAFGIWGTTVLDRAFATGQIKPGYLCCITYLGGIPTDFQDAKMFNIQVVKK